MSPSAQKSTKTYLIFLIIFCILIYIFSQYFRNSISIIAPNLRSEFLLDPQQVAFLALVFFLSFTLVQIPLGVIIDHLGPRLCLLACVIITTIGCFIFSQATHYNGLILGRALMGVGCSSFFMVPLVLFTRYFSSKKFSLLTAMLLSFGNLGAWISTTPLGYSVQKYGWQNTFFFSTIGIGVIGTLAIIIIKDSESHHKITTKSKGVLKDIAEQFYGAKDVMKIQSFWPLMVMHFCHYGPLSMMNALWAGPFLSDVHGLDVAQRGEILGYASITLIVSFMIWNQMELLLRRRKAIIIFATCLSIISLAALALLENISIVMTTFLIGLFYFSMGHTPCLITHGRTMIPKHLIGRGITTFNMGIMGGVFFFQWLTGFIINLVDKTIHDNTLTVNFKAYQYAFLSTIAVMIIGLLIYLSSHEKPFTDDN